MQKALTENVHTKSSTSLLIIILLLLAGMNGRCQAQDYTITVSAGGLDRSSAVVSFHFPDEVPPGVYRMESEEADPVYLQVDNHSKGWFILDKLQAGASITYSLVARATSSMPPGAGVTSSVNRNTISFQSGGRKVLSYYYDDNDPPDELDERYKRGGYIHPVYSPDSTVLTNHLDTEVHPHHYGIWSAWTNTLFQGRTPDFWNVQNNTGRVDHADSLEVAWEGPVHAGFLAKNYLVDLSAPSPVIALNEEWKVRVYNTGASGDYHMFDLIVTQTANTAQPLFLPDYRYGGVAFRGHGDWNDPDNVSFLTSEEYDRSNGNETRARWCLMGGMVDGKRAGMAVLGHPDNYRSPQPVRIHPDIPYFVYAPVQLGAMAIEPGSPYVARYRCITYDGEPDPEKLNRLWNDYAYPPGVTVVAN